MRLDEGLDEGLCHESCLLSPRLDEGLDQGALAGNTRKKQDANQVRINSAYIHIHAYTRAAISTYTHTQVRLCQERLYSHTYIHTYIHTYTQVNQVR
jgi:hypothetical protein